MKYHNKATCPFIYEHKKNNGEFNFDTIIHKNFENRTKNTKDMRKSVNMIKVAQKLLQSFQTAMDVLYSNMFIMMEMLKRKTTAD